VLDPVKFMPAAGQQEPFRIEAALGTISEILGPACALLITIPTEARVIAEREVRARPGAGRQTPVGAHNDHREQQPGT